MRTLVGLLRRTYPWMIVACLLLGPQSRCYADGSSATLSVTVSDNSGAVIANASVTVRNVDTDQEQHGTSNPQGNATFLFLKPGRYSLLVKKTGFAEIAVNNILLNVGDDRAMRLSLKVGSTEQSVIVDGTGATINTTDGSVSTVVGRRFVENLPLNGRSLQDLILLTPGVITASPQNNTSVGVGNSGDFSVNGQRTESNYYMVDGVAQNASAGSGLGQAGAGSGGNLGSGTALGTTQSLVSVDALEEFRVSSSTYSAEYGHTPGGQFSLVTRSGTSAIHGSVFDYLRNNFFDANDWFNDHYLKQQTALRQNDFGGTVGGPLSIPYLLSGKNKRFFFLSYEGLRLVQPQPASLQYVPSNSIRQQAAPAIQPILNAFPLPTGPELPNSTGAASGLAPFVAAYSLPAQIDSTSLRIDDTINSRWHIFARAAYSPSYSGVRVLSQPGKQSSNIQSYTLGATTGLSDALSNDLRIGYTRSVAKYVTTLDNFGGATPFDFSSAVGSGAFPRAAPYFYFSITGIGTDTLTLNNTANYQQQWNVTDIATWQHGHHLAKLGVDYRRIASPFAAFDAAVSYYYYDRPSLVTNSNSGAIARQFGSSPLYNQFSLFVQDEWRVSPSVSVSAGVRWEIDPAPTSQNNIKPTPLDGDLNNLGSLTLGPAGATLYPTTYGNFAPRLGIAWKAHEGSDKVTVVRAGSGLFYDTGSSSSTLVFSGPAAFQSKSFTNLNLPVTPAQLNFAPSTTPPYTGSVYAISPHFQLPYTIQWSAALEQTLTRYDSVTLSYVGANGRRLVGEQLLHLTPFNPAFSVLGLYANRLTSSYNSLQLKYQRQVTRNLQALASYTWAHSLDFGSTNAALSYQRGNSDFDLRNNLSGALSWEPLIHPRNWLGDALLSGWATDFRLAARTAFPVNLTGSSYYDPASTLLTVSQLNLVPDAPLYIYSPNLPGGRAINAKAFSKAPSGTQGNAPRNFIRGFGELQADIAIRREFVIREGIRLQFRADTFNVPNHPNFGTIDSSLTDATFGQATKSLSQSLPTMSPLYQQGGPRSMQFALKLLF
jgi:hypothetical protein